MRVRVRYAASTRLALGITAALLAVLTACGDPESSPIAASPPAGIVPATSTFPTLEPFETSAFWGMLTSSPDPRAMADQLEQLPGAMERLETPLASETNGDAPRRKAKIAELTPQLVPARRVLWMLVPTLVASLKPQWERGDWSADETALAKVAGTFLAGRLGTPALKYSGRTPAQNQAWLRKLVAWFRTRTERKEYYAAMMGTLDDGPYVGLDVEIAQGAQAIASIQLSDDLTLEGHRTTIAGAERYAVRALHKGVPLWSRALTSSSGEAYDDVHLEGLTADALGTYGWRLHFFVGGEHAHLYVAPDGTFLFYFVSW